jgi:hypothetical protein
MKKHRIAFAKLRFDFAKLRFDFAKLRFAFAAGLAVCALPLAAFDFGLSLSNDSTYTYQDAGTLQQVNRALAWASSPLGGNADLYLSGFYEFKGSYLKDSSDVEPWRFDAGRVELSGSVPGAFGPSSALRYSAGRINTGDFSTQVLSSLSDGTRLEADFGNASLYFTGGYRGLLSKDDAYSFMSANDAQLNADSDRYFAPPRAFFGLGFRLAELFSEHDVGLEAFGQFDLSDASDKVHSQYLEPYIKGRLSHLLGWEAWGIVETREAGEVFWAAAFGEKLVLSLPQTAGLKFTQSAAWASGDQGSMSAFTPIRRAPIDATSFFSFTDLLQLKLEASASPVRKLALNLGLAGYFRSGTVDPESQQDLGSGAAYYRGFEISGGASAKVSSDLSLNLSSGVLIPNTGSAYPDSAHSRYATELYAAFDL